MGKARTDRTRNREIMDGQTLQRLITLFDGKGWLDRPVGLRHGGTGYRLFCSHSEFRAYRINHQWGISPGVPCWPVCVISRNRVYHDSDLGPFPSGELTALQWLESMAAGEYEIM